MLQKQIELTRLANFHIQTQAKFFRTTSGTPFNTNVLYKSSSIINLPSWAFLKLQL